jgi:hypothetical protein
MLAITDCLQSSANRSMPQRISGLRGAIRCSLAAFATSNVSGDAIRTQDLESMLGGFGTAPGNSPSWLTSADMRARAVHVAHLQVPVSACSCACVCAACVCACMCTHPPPTTSSLRPFHTARRTPHISDLTMRDVVVPAALHYQGQAYGLVRVRGRCKRGRALRMRR